jgi:hypothetical protein
MVVSDGDIDNNGLIKPLIEHGIQRGIATDKAVITFEPFFILIVEPVPVRTVYHATPIIPIQFRYGFRLSSHNESVPGHTDIIYGMSKPSKDEFEVCNYANVLVDIEEPHTKASISFLQR